MRGASGYVLPVLLGVSCANGNETASVPRVSAMSVIVDPPTAAVTLRATQQFGATVEGASDRSVAWSVLEPSGGTITRGGLYVAPAAPGTFHVIATSNADPARTATATVVVGDPKISVTISLSSASLSPRATTDIVAVVTGTSDTAVVWSATGGMVYRGVFFAPDWEGTFLVTATSAADPTKSATATVTVTGPVQNGVTITANPETATVMAGKELVFHASVPGISDQRVTWSVQEGPAGGYVIGAEYGYYYAPAAEGTFHVVATSIANPALSGVAPVRVTWGEVVDHGGLIVPAINVTALWWGDPAAFPSDLRPGIEEVFGALDGTKYLAVADQYMRGAKARLAFAGSLTDSSDPPRSSPTPDQVAAEVCKVLDAKGVRPGANDYYMVIAPDFPSDAPIACGFHDVGMCHGTTILIAWLPSPTSIPRCQWWTAEICDGASRVTQSLANNAVHEVFEVMSDPLGDAWLNSDLGWAEIGDKCAWTYGCLALGAHKWAIQSMWSNAAHACVVE